MNRRYLPLFASSSFVLSSILSGCGGAAVQPTITAVPPTATMLPPTPTPMSLTARASSTPGGLSFSVNEDTDGQYGDGASLAGGTWQGMTTENGVWLSVSFQVDSVNHSISQIIFAAGCDDPNGSQATFELQKASATIEPNGAFHFSDAFGNFLKGTFGSGSFAFGTSSGVPFNVDCNGEFRTPPTQWRAAPQ